MNKTQEAREYQKKCPLSIVLYTYLLEQNDKMQERGQYEQLVSNVWRNGEYTPSLFWRK